MRIIRTLARGAAAGAAGTTALNAVTYVDMAVRGRGTSSAPQDVVEQSAEKVGIAIPGEGDTRDNRLAGLGPLSGTLVGVAVGALAGLMGTMLRERNVSVPSVVSRPAAILLIGAAATALADIPLKVLGISDPQEWAAKDWAADAVPHLVYGVATYATLQAID